MDRAHGDAGGRLGDRGQLSRPAQDGARGGAAHLELGFRARRGGHVRARPARLLHRQAHDLRVAVLDVLPVDGRHSRRPVRARAAWWARWWTSFRNASSLVLAIAPEGTRRKVERFRTGFLHIARGAGVPVVLVGLDYSTRTIRIGPVIEVGEDIEAERRRVEAHFAKRPGPLSAVTVGPGGPGDPPWCCDAPSCSARSRARPQRNFATP